MCILRKYVYFLKKNQVTYFLIHSGTLYIYWKCQEIYIFPEIWERFLYRFTDTFDAIHNNIYVLYVLEKTLFFQTNVHFKTKTEVSLA